MYRLATYPSEPEWLYWLKPDGTPVARVLRSEFERALKEGR